MKTRTVHFKNFTASFPADLLAFVKLQVSESDLTLSAYLRRLIKTDLNKIKESAQSGDIIK